MYFAETGFKPVSTILKFLNAKLRHSNYDRTNQTKRIYKGYI